MKELLLNIGRYDNPLSQEQNAYAVDLYSKNLAIIGGAMSGKTTLIKTILVHLHQLIKTEDCYKEEIYILDFSNDLKKYKDLPFVRAYFSSSNVENIRRLFRIVEDKYYDNARDLQGTVYNQYNNNEKPISHITLIIDGLSSFFEDNQNQYYYAILLKIIREGLSKGITTIFTASDTSNGIGKLLNNCKSIIALDLPKDKYNEIFLTRVEKPISLCGRGVANKGVGIHEFQAYLPYNIRKYQNSEGENDFLEALKKKMRNKHGENHIDALIKRQLKNFDGDLTKGNWLDYSTEPLNSFEENNKVHLGIDYYSFEPIAINYEMANSIAIYGKRKSGKSNLVQLLIKGLPSNCRFVLFDNRGKPDDIVKCIMEEKEREYKYVDKIEELATFVVENGYYNISKEIFSSKRIEDFERKNNPFTVFIIQGSSFYSAVVKSNTGIVPRFPEYIKVAAS